MSLDLGGRSVRTWAYNEAVPGPLMRVTAGDVLNLTLANRRSAATTPRAHGVRLPSPQGRIGAAPWQARVVPPKAPGDQRGRLGRRRRNPSRRSWKGQSNVVFSRWSPRACRPSGRGGHRPARPTRCAERSPGTGSA
ncbi:multicopper oxidase domain-containing protein [Streptomyces chiangmaiensis]|uniref:Multicopper oxidase domain-containing protein n=1 Tax=Streptomyces chiangmaiensis TaxID=766497 RepID=A0ABU7FUZ9_9ACTN|nr:multicopper oxidase domain-containing protein [Streptomyces chiangmaiensis]MED7827940.1 multicopper oxidase domain-containing protein [Streptomyces chiangmaiensis]